MNRKVMKASILRQLGDKRGLECMELSERFGRREPKRRRGEFCQESSMIVRSRSIGKKYVSWQQAYDNWCELMDNNVHENRMQMFNAGKGAAIQKRAKNDFSKKEAGTMGATIRLKRFSNSRLTCVYKAK